MQRIFISGVGVVSSIGFGHDAFFRALAEGTSGITEVEKFDVKDVGRARAGEIKGFRPLDHLTPAEDRRMGRCSAMAVAATRMALTDSRLDPRLLRGPKTAVVVGTTMGEADVLGELQENYILKGENAVRSSLVPKYGATLLPIHVARAVQAEGIVLSLPAACAAGNYAISIAADLIRSGRVDVAVAGATELIQRLQFFGFARLAAMAPEKCQPFDLNRQGLLLGEGAGMVILESEAHIVRRGGVPRAEIGGYGLSCDGYHITRPHPEAKGSVSAMRTAIRRSGITSDQIDFINAHGTGTRHNDIAETRVLKEVFGDRRVPISSMKSMLGHCMGAASALEAIGCLMTLETGIYPPTINYETPDPECDVDVVANSARRGKADVVVNNSLAFGGYNSVTVFARPGVLPPPDDRPVGEAR